MIDSTTLTRIDLNIKQTSNCINNNNRKREATRCWPCRASANLYVCGLHVHIYRNIIKRTVVNLKNTTRRNNNNNHNKIYIHRFVSRSTVFDPSITTNNKLIFTLTLTLSIEVKKREKKQTKSNGKISRNRERWKIRNTGGLSSFVPIRIGSIRMRSVQYVVSDRRGSDAWRMKFYKYKSVEKRWIWYIWRSAVACNVWVQFQQKLVACIYYFSSVRFMRVKLQMRIFLTCEKCWFWLLNNNKVTMHVWIEWTRKK